MADIVFPGEAAGGPINQDHLPENYDLVLYKGDTFTMNLSFTDSNNVVLDLTGYVAKCQIRSTFSAVTSYDAACTVDGPSGTVTVKFDAATTETISAGSYVWDFQLTSAGGDVRTYLAGDVTVYDEVTV